eukprot:2367728-Amphidinium_carterae.2
MGSGGLCALCNCTIAAAALIHSPGLPAKPKDSTRNNTVVASPSIFAPHESGSIRSHARSRQGRWGHPQ